MATITQISAREILDSRGIPTIECEIWLDSGHRVISSAAGGTSKGKFEAVELRDNNPQRMNGLGVLKAVELINTTVAPQLVGQDPSKQTELDQLLINLDGTADKSKLGANTINVVSQTILKAGAVSANQPLYYYLQQKYQISPSLVIPNCIYTLINGGAHGADNLDIQEFEVIPASNMVFPDSLNLAVTLFHKLEEVLVAKGAIHSVGLVGGFTPNLFNNTDAFEILVETTKATPFTFAQQVFLGADMAATTLFEGGKYHLKDKSQPYSAKDLHEYYASLRSIYHAFYIEDPFQEEDTENWQKITADLGKTTLIVGDTLLATNIERLSKAIQDKSCNAILVKPNQGGTISETLQVIKTAKDAGWTVIISHRSGETADDILADIAVGVGAQYVKFGPPQREERVAKYNRLLEIYDEIGQMRQAQQKSQQPSPIEQSQTAEPAQTAEQVADPNQAQQPAQPTQTKEQSTSPQPEQPQSP